MTLKGILGQYFLPVSGVWHYFARENSAAFRLEWHYLTFSSVNGIGERKK
jgi:hypothetical protein